MNSFFQDGHIIPFTTMCSELHTLCHTEIRLCLKQEARAGQFPTSPHPFAHNFSFCVSLTATGSRHHRLLRCRPGTRGPGRDVLQQLLPLHALSRSSARGDSPGPVGAQREAGAGESGQPGLLRKSPSKARPTPGCVDSPI